MRKGLVNNDVKVSVLNMLKPIICAYQTHGDIKEIFEIDIQ